MGKQIILPLINNLKNKNKRIFNKSSSEILFFGYPKYVRISRSRIIKSFKKNNG